LYGLVRLQLTSETDKELEILILRQQLSITTTAAAHIKALISNRQLSDHSLRPKGSSKNVVS